MTDTVRGKRFEELFDLIGDPVVEFQLIGEVPVVRDVNSAFESVFGYGRDQVLGESLNEFIVPADRANEAGRFDRRTSEGKRNTGLITRETVDGPREFFYRGVPYERDGAQYGFAIYSDVTDQRSYERHMRVVHRLLRHDLRNELQIIAGAADQIRATGESDAVRGLAEMITAHADRLSSTGEETRVIEGVLMEENRSATVDAAALCRSVAEQIDREHTDASVVTETPEALEVTAVSELRTALLALVENGAIHGGDHPTVRVCADSRPDGAVITVADDGSGIPTDFRAPVFEDRSIGQFQHNRGLGLWLVRWVIEACGGCLGYDRRDGWTVIELMLRPAPDSDDPSSATDG